MTDGFVDFIVSVPGVIILILLSCLVYKFGGGIFADEAATLFRFLNGFVPPIMMGLK